MPFTVAHAAAALPVRRLKLIWSAFVIGTLAPDFEAFLTLSDFPRDGHHFPGVLTFTLPAGLLTLWLFHRFLKEPLVELAPDGLRLRLLPYVGEFQFSGLRRFAAIVGSMALGVATHLLWDSFTHSYTWPYNHFAWLQETNTVYLPNGPHLLSHVNLLQHLSSVLGCVALAIWFIVWYRRTEPAATPAHRPTFTQGLRLSIAALILALPWLLAAFLAYLRGHVAEDFLHVRTFARYLVLLPGSLLALEVLVYAVVANRLLTQHQTDPR